LRHLTTIGDKPQLVLIHSAVSPDHLLVVEFDTHNLRRDFVNHLAGITPPERILYLQKRQFDGNGVTSFLVDRQKSLGGSRTPEEITEDAIDDVPKTEGDIPTNK
jgi:hypothetical protein